MWHKVKFLLQYTIGRMSRVFANGLGSIPGRIIPKTQKITTLLNIQHYKVWVKGKVEQSSERNSVLPYNSV